jgi:hypothetical protein
MIMREEGNSMPRIDKLIAMLVFTLIIAVLTPGCYTIVGYAPEVEEGIIAEEEAVPGQAYRDYEYYYDRPYSYYWDYYDPYYGLWYPYSYYYYRDYPRWRYYNDYYYWYYDDHYVPEKKPGPRRLGTSELRRIPRPESRSRNRLEGDEDREQPSREIQSRQRAADRIQRSVIRKHRDSTSSSEKRSTKRKSEDEEK